MTLDTVDKILDFAIGKEEEAAEFYTGLATKMDKPHMRDLFETFAGEERGHRAKLILIKEGGELKLEKQKILDLKIADYIRDVEPSSDLTYQQALNLAMKAEKAAFKLYTNLAEQTDDSNLKNLFNGLAQEEAKHKLRFEIEYDQEILTEN